MNLAEQIAAMQAPAHTPEPMPPGVMQALRLSDLTESPTNPRREYGDLAELTASIATIGVLQPLLVRPIPEPAGRDARPRAGSGYEVVFGHRRLRAAKEAGLETVPCDVRPLTDVQVLEAQLVENLQRADIKPMDEAVAFERLQKATGYTADQMAERVGKSKSWVYQRLKLNSLCPEGQQALADGKLHASVAVAIARIPAHKLQAKAVAKTIEAAESGKSTAEQMLWLRDAYCRALKSAPFDTKDDMLLAGASSCLKCPKNSANAPRGMFDDLQREAIPYCTDLACWDGKATEAWQSAVAKYEAKGAKILSRDAAKKLFQQDGSLIYDTKYVEAKRHVAEDRQKRSWTQLLDGVDDEARPKLFVAASPKGKPVELYLESEVTKALADAGITWAERRVDDLEQRTKPTKAKAPGEADREEMERQARAVVVGQLVDTAAPKLGASWSLPLARLIGRWLVDHGAHSEFQTRFVERHRIKDLGAWVDSKADKEALLVFLAGMALDDMTRDVWSGFTETAQAMAKTHGVDLAKLLEGEMAAAGAGKGKGK